jgi:hypothetical protein
MKKNSYMGLNFNKEKNRHILRATIKIKEIAVVLHVPYFWAVIIAIMVSVLNIFYIINNLHAG